MLPVYRHFRSGEKLVGWRERFTRKKGTSSLIRGSKRSPESQKTTESNYHNDSPLASWAESCIFAGTSALLLLIAKLLPYYWYFSIFALVPFLYRLIKATPTGSLRLGILLGISFFAVSVMSSFPISPLHSVFKLLVGTGLFAIFGWSAGCVRKYWGFNPFVVVILWIGLELGMMKLRISSGLFKRIETSAPLLHSLITLLGFLILSVIIIFLNSLLVLAIIKTLELTKPKGNSTQEKDNRREFSLTHDPFSEKVYVVPEGRAPPSIISLSLYTVLFS